MKREKTVDVSISAQLEALKALAAAKGCQVVGRHVDVARSR